MPTVDFIYDGDCPNAARARANLQRAFAAAAVPARWLEWERAAPATPATLKAYGSPTILINGRDAAGAAPGEATHCRLYAAEAGGYTGVPAVPLLAAALKANSVETARAAGSKRCAACVTAASSKMEESHS